MDRREFLRLCGPLLAVSCTPLPLVIQNESSSGSSSSPLPTPSLTPSPTTSPTSSPSPSPILALPNVSGKRLGFTYSYPHATWLFNDMDRARGVLWQLIDNFKPEVLRLEAYWNWIQDTGRDVMRLTNHLWWQLDNARKENVKTVILCLGRKVPHWPEFHIPDWAKRLSEKDQQEALLSYIEQVVRVYSTDSLITHWQVENEPFFNFGDGSSYSNQAEFLAREVKLVRDGDTLRRPIIITDSGDKGDWVRAAENADILGITYYSRSYENGRYEDHTTYGTAEEFRGKIARVGKEVWNIEHQAEPWGPSSLRDLSPDEARKSMDPERLKRDLTFVLEAGLSTNIFWGAEWWLWEEEHGRPEMMNLARDLFRAARQ